MVKTRVLVVDDSVVVRTLVSDVLAEDPLLEVAGVAANGKIALQKLLQVNPDVVTMDVEMPVMNGIEALKEIRKSHPLLPVIMLSSLTEKGASITLEALSSGASDYVAKPTNSGGVTQGKHVLKQELIPKIYSLCRLSEGQRHEVIKQPLAPKPEATEIRFRQVMSQRLDAIVIGVSTGGPNALEKIIPYLPPNFPVPVVIVQHMPPIFTKSLADRLNSKAPLEVVEAVDGEELKAGKVIIAPGGLHVALVKEGQTVRARLNQDPPENSCRPAVDVLFRSAAKVFGPNVLGVVLTGMGQDGLRGAEHIVDAGGQVIAQDEATSVVWGMPGFVARAGYAQKVLPIEKVADELTSKAQYNRISRA